MSGISPIPPLAFLEELEDQNPVSQGNQPHEEPAPTLVFDDEGELIEGRKSPVEVKEKKKKSWFWGGKKPKKEKVEQPKKKVEKTPNVKKSKKEKLEKPQKEKKPKKEKLKKPKKGKATHHSVVDPLDEFTISSEFSKQSPLPTTMTSLQMPVKKTSSRRRRACTPHRVTKTPSFHNPPPKGPVFTPNLYGNPDLSKSFSWLPGAEATSTTKKVPAPPLPYKTATLKTKFGLNRSSSASGQLLPVAIPAVPYPLPYKPASLEKKFGLDGSSVPPTSTSSSVSSFLPIPRNELQPKSIPTEPSTTPLLTQEDLCNLFGTPEYRKSIYCLTIKMKPKEVAINEKVPASEDFQPVLAPAPPLPLPHNPVSLKAKLVLNGSTLPRTSHSAVSSFLGKSNTLPLTSTGQSIRVSSFFKETKSSGQLEPVAIPALPIPLPYNPASLKAKFGLDGSTLPTTSSSAVSPFLGKSSTLPSTSTGSSILSSFHKKPPASGQLQQVAVPTLPLPFPYKPARFETKFGSDGASVSPTSSSAVSSYFGKSRTLPSTSTGPSNFVSSFFKETPAPGQLQPVAAPAPPLRLPYRPVSFNAKFGVDGSTLPRTSSSPVSSFLDKSSTLPSTSTGGPSILSQLTNLDGSSSAVSYFHRKLPASGQLQPVAIPVLPLPYKQVNLKEKFGLDGATFPRTSPSNVSSFLGESSTLPSTSTRPASFQIKFGLDRSSAVSSFFKEASVPEQLQPVAIPTLPLPLPYKPTILQAKFGLDGATLPRTSPSAVSSFLGKSSTLPSTSIGPSILPQVTTSGSINSSCGHWTVRGKYFESDGDDWSDEDSEGSFEEED